MSDIEQLSLDFDAGLPPANLRQLWTPDDIYNNVNAENIVSFKEDGRVERKPCGIHPEHLAEWVCMWANTQPYGGLIFIGVEDKGEITGCKSLSTAQINKLELVRTYCSDARHEFKKVAVTNKDGQADFVMVLRVYYREDKLVETNSSNSFVRVGDEKHRLTEAAKQEIRIARGQVQYELEPVTLKWPDDFDIPLADQLADSFRQKRGLTKPQTREQILSLLHLGKRSGNALLPNLACALLLAKDPRTVIPGARIRVSRYDGTQEKFGKDMNQVFDTFIDGPLPTQIAEANRVIGGQIKNFTRLGPDSRFYTQPEYPREAWLEAVVNACVHRSYNLKQMNIFVKMFSDKLVVESPGGFLPPTTAETIYDSHNPRNPYIMEALFYLEYVHCAYEGTRRMRDTMAANSLPPPEFSQKEMGTHQVHVVLKNDVEHRKTFIDANAAGLIGQTVWNTLTEPEKMLINFVGEHGKISVTDAVRLTDKAWKEAKAILLGLVDRKILTVRSRTGKNKESSKRYVLNKS